MAGPGLPSFRDGCRPSFPPGRGAPLGGGVAADGTAARAAWAMSGSEPVDVGDAVSWVPRGATADAPVGGGGVVGAFDTPGTLSGGAGAVPVAGRGGS
jgi:hypothetical protein